MPSQLEDICRYAVVIRIVGIYGYCSKLLVVAYSFIPIHGIFLNFSTYEKGGSVGPVKQLIKLTWPITIYDWISIKVKFIIKLCLTGGQ